MRAAPLTIALCAVALLAGLAARFPLSATLALGGARGAGLDWRAAEGTVWSGHVRGLTLHEYQLGDLRASLAPLSLLTLSPRLSLQLAGPEADASARVTLRPGGLRIADGAARLRLSEVVAIDPRLRTRGGVLTAADVRIALRGGRCVEASGVLESDALTYGFGGGWRGPSLSGALACEDGAVTARLGGAGEGQGVQAVAFLGGGAYRVEASVASRDPELARIAPLIGFAEYGGGWRYRWTSAP